MKLHKNKNNTSIYSFDYYYSFVKSISIKKIVYNKEQVEDALEHKIIITAVNSEKKFPGNFFSREISREMSIENSSLRIEISRNN